MLRWIIILGLTSFLLLTSSLAGASAEERRHALLFGAQDYDDNIGDLTNTHDDVRRVRSALELVGFRPITILDPTNQEMLDALSDFELAIQADLDASHEVVIFFYASMHGVSAEIKGTQRNILIPARTTFKTLGEITTNGFRVDSLIERLSVSGAKAVFVVIDACREELAGAISKGNNKGLVAESGGPGMLIAFATPEGGTTPDDGLFSTVLSREIQKPGRRATVALLDTVEKVGLRRPATGQPYFLPNKIPNSFCFNGCFDGSTSTALAPDQIDFRRIISADVSGVCDEYDRFMMKYPNSALRNAIEALKNQPPCTAKSGIFSADGSDRAIDLAAEQQNFSAQRLQDCDNCPVMISIPRGTFIMGSPDPEIGRELDEGPQRVVHITKSIAISETEITWEHWESCVEARACQGTPTERAGGDMRWGKGRHPVINVSWHDAQDFVAWMRSTTGKRYRLLSEEEWEYAARSNNATPFSFGRNVRADQANYDSTFVYSAGTSEAPPSRTVPVASYDGNEFGLFDMHGNVYEWLKDCSTARSGSDATLISASAPTKCESRVIRGGSWDDPPHRIRSAAREHASEDVRNALIGFRVALDLE